MKDLKDMHQLTKIKHRKNPLTKNGMVEVGSSFEGRLVQGPEIGRAVIVLGNKGIARVTTEVDKILEPKNGFTRFRTLNSFYKLKQLES